jgi:SagB-type dehydrogenase family enzyme
MRGRVGGWPTWACAGLLAVAMAAATAGAAWAQQVGQLVPLPPPALSGTLSVEAALQQRRSMRALDPSALALSDASQLLWAAQGVTDSRGARTAPSAGALYPLEIYLLAGQVTGLAAGVYRYQPQDHALRMARAGDPRALLRAALRGQDWVGQAPAALLIGAEFERTAQKYGERAARYVPLEAGAAAQNVYLQATARGLGTTLVGAFDETRLRQQLELPAALVPLALMPVGRPR